MRKECPNTNYPSEKLEQGVLEGPVGCLNVKGAQAKTRIILEGLKM